MRMTTRIMSQVRALRSGSDDKAPAPTCFAIMVRRRITVPLPANLGGGMLPLFMRPQRQQ